MKTRDVVIIGVVGGLTLVLGGVLAAVLWDLRLRVNGGVFGSRAPR